MPKIKFQEILKSPYKDFYKIMVDKLFYQINACIHSNEDKEEYGLSLINNNGTISYVTNLNEEFEYDFIEVQPRIQLKCELCGDIVEEKYGKSFKADPKNMTIMIKELEDFSKDYTKSGVQRFHNCVNFEFGMTRIVGFVIV